MDILCDFEPAVIQKLDPVVVNKIAAGEIIKRPANALKEMIENCLDANSTAIQITVKSGGLKYLQIRDNGTGIRKDDLGIVCERFTTSKLKQFEDLQSIATYGFRGEALSSISHVAHLTIQTKTANDKCAYKASYEDGRLKGDIKSCAGNQGTQITVEDMFFNMSQRKQLFKSASEEFSRILDVVSKYAIHNANVSFTLTKQGENVALRTPINSTKQDNIKIVYGADVVNEMKTIECQDEPLQFKMYALATSVKYSSKKFTFLLFINHRLVESTAIKNAIDQCYAPFLPKGNHPFVYMDLQIEPKNVDVNMHPTKHEVNFLYETEIVDKIRWAFEGKLVGSNETREVYTQQLLPGASNPGDVNGDQASQGKETKVYAKDMVRSDSKEQKLEKFFGKSFAKDSQDNTETTINVSFESEFTLNDNNESNLVGRKSFILPARTNGDVKRKQTKLTSILTLRKKIESRCDGKLRQILADSNFVGCINRRQSLIQSGSNLYICDVQKLSEELFYQLLMYDFENFCEIRFENPLSIKDLAILALNNEESGWCEQDGPISELAENVEEALIKKADMLREYYGLSISSSGHLETLPLILDNHTPSLGHLPMYILRLVTEVDWAKERQCFETFCRETAMYYARTTLIIDECEWKWLIEHVYYDNIKKYLIPSAQLGTLLLPVANLQNLYKVFERC
ncbi:DNA mismatch repair protein Mlh1 [Sitodiplosis mosellana]|uniref:DNA mismatch repair protein Mlh1 n=1 Tax=Sitodiplosis mosellana TaxID=263140 RepID=UPI00244518C5|nr:DNA mismatch repair protein Mlh1 [Sitodiplosis mosellana]